MLPPRSGEQRGAARNVAEQTRSLVIDWYADVLTEGKHLGASGYHISLGEPRHVDATGGNAYVVVPATMTFSLQGKQITQAGSTLTVALRKVETEWRLPAWAWAKGTAQAG